MTDDPCDDITSKSNGEHQERFHEWILRKTKEERDAESDNRHRDGKPNT